MLCVSLSLSWLRDLLRNDTPNTHEILGYICVYGRISRRAAKQVCSIAGNFVLGVLGLESLGIGCEVAMRYECMIL